MRYLTSWALEVPGLPRPYDKPPSATSPSYIELLEDNTHVIYPALAVLALVLVAAGIMQALKTDNLTGIKKAEVKRELIRELRRDITGRTAEQLAKLLDVPNIKMLQLLEELAAEGIVESRTDTQRLTTWRLKGLLY